MNKQVYGEMIVDQIINGYKSSEEYRDEARAFIYKWFINIVNHKIGEVGCIFAQSGMDEEAKKEFIDNMEKWKDLKEKLDYMFSWLDESYCKTLFPSNINIDN